MKASSQTRKAYTQEGRHKFRLLVYFHGLKQDQRSSKKLKRFLSIYMSNPYTQYIQYFFPLGFSLSMKDLTCPFTLGIVGIIFILPTCNVRIKSSLTSKKTKRNKERKKNHVKFRFAVKNPPHTVKFS